MNRQFLIVITVSILLNIELFAQKVIPDTGFEKSPLTSQANDEPDLTTKGHPKIVKTQGTGPSANVHCGLQDRSGNLWFGTTGEGVYRYDGRSFVNFIEKDGLSNNNIWCVYEDKDGNIWVGTGDGICRYDPSFSPGNGLRPFYILPITDPSNDPSSKCEVWSILQDRTGQLWFGTDKGIYCYSHGRFTRFLDNDEVINTSHLHLRHIQGMLEDRIGNIWFVSWNHEGVCRYDGKSIIRFTNKDGLTDDMIHSILQDKAGNIWVGARNGGIYRYDGRSFTHFTEKEGPGNNCIYSILEDKAGNIWFATEPRGAWRYDPSTSSTADPKTFTKLTTKDGLSDNSVFCILEDRSGKLWFGTRGVGLCRYDGKNFVSFSE